jgi:hypothetical protein
VHLLRCCRADRPRKKGETLLVKATGAFLTIHDYLSVVHPWLLRRREDIFGTEGDLVKNEPLAANTKLMISYGLPDQVNFETVGDWRENMSQEPLKIDFTNRRSAFAQPLDLPFGDVFKKKRPRHRPSDTRASIYKGNSILFGKLNYKEQADT